MNSRKADRILREVRRKTLAGAAVQFSCCNWKKIKPRTRLALLALIVCLTSGCVSRRRFLRDLTISYRAGQLNVAKESAAIAYSAKQGKMTTENACNLILSRFILYWNAGPQVRALEQMIEEQEVNGK